MTVLLSGQPVQQTIQNQISQVISTPKPTISPTPIPKNKILENGGYHVFQTFNNCGPAALSMALSFYGIDVSQQVLGQALRPWQNHQGDNDDKSTTLEELAEKSKEYGFVSYHRPNGNSDIIKQLIALDLPVITRTYTKPGEDIGHYRVIKGYDESSQEFIQDDSLQGKNLRYSYENFNKLWQAFNYEYLVLAPPEKQIQVENILGENKNYEKAWKIAADNSRAKLANDPNDINARFNLSVALHNIGDDAGSVKEFEAVESQLPFRTLWYQIEPIEAYYNLGNYDRVFELSEKILNNHNRAFSELYILRGNSYRDLGNQKLANKEYELAKLYNSNIVF